MEFRTNKKTGKAYPLGKKNGKGIRSSQMTSKNKKELGKSKYAKRTFQWHCDTCNVDFDPSKDHSHDKHDTGFSGMISKNSNRKIQTNGRMVDENGKTVGKQVFTENGWENITSEYPTVSYGGTNPIISDEDLNADVMDEIMGLEEMGDEGPLGEGHRINLKDDASFVDVRHFVWHAQPFVAAVNRELRNRKYYTGIKGMEGHYSLDENWKEINDGVEATAFTDNLLYAPNGGISIYVLNREKKIYVTGHYDETGYAFARKFSSSETEQALYYIRYVLDRLDNNTHLHYESLT